MFTDDYSNEYSDKSFWEKVKKYAKLAGMKVVYVALLLYYTLEGPNVPTKSKAIILGALGYFILPIDLVPDIIAIVGYGDDLALLTWALIQVGLNITPEIRDKAKLQLTNLFGEINESEIIDIDIKLDSPDDFPKGITE